MKTYRIHLIIIVLCIMFAHSMAYQDELEQEEECFTDACLCVDDCLEPLQGE